MTYASLSDLIDRAGEDELRQVADRDRDGVIDQELILAALTTADDAVDGYIGVKYDLPLTSVPPQVKAWSVSIARYTLHRNAAPDFVERDYKDTISALKDVARGLIALPVVGGGSAPALSGGGVMASHPDPVFTANRLRGW